MNSELINDQIYFGTKLKFLIELSAPGFDMDADEFTVTLRGKNNRKVYDKAALETDGEGSWYVCFDTVDFGPGPIQMTIEAEVPDECFESGTRTEVVRYNLINVLR